jgi:hypothetical protein
MFRGQFSPLNGDLSDEMALENVKNRWKEQGIWKDEWEYGCLPDGLWKHQEPLELEAESETDSEAEVVRPLFDYSPKRRRPKNDEEKQKIAERRVIREREREASRPYYQFCYQVSKERERIEVGPESAQRTWTVDINTLKAYENVKNTWVKRGIWDQRWGTLPGMSWMHEVPLEEIDKDANVYEDFMNGKIERIWDHSSEEYVGPIDFNAFAQLLGM